jgi:hypothetical protein
MQIAAEIQQSRLQKWAHALLFVVVSLLLILSNLPWWTILLTLLALLIFSLYQTFYHKPKPKLLELIQLERNVWRWYESTVGATHSVQCEGLLQMIHRWPWVMVLGFLSTRDGNAQNVQRVYQVIWRDQVDADTWRRLTVLARFWVKAPDYVQR